MTIYRDPRLSNPLLLALAAQRLLHRQAQPPPVDWQHTDGLASLLDYARRLPPVDPWDLPGVYEGAAGFGHVLWQARQWQEEHDRET